MRALCTLLAATTLLLIGGCPSTTSDPNDPNSTAAVVGSWIDGTWSADAKNLSQNVSGCLTITNEAVARWGSGCDSGLMTILSAPAATGSADHATVNVTVSSSTAGLMNITLGLTRVTDNLLTGTIMTLSLGQEPFIGAITLTRQ